MEIFRHGGEAHVMRPDGVYRTSVLQPMVGYQPQHDVEAVLREFTQGPFLATRVPMTPGASAAVSGFAGLFGLGQPGPIQRLGLRIRAAFARARAKRFMMAGLAGYDSPPFGPAYQAAQQVSPHLAHQMTHVLSIMGNYAGAGNYPAPAADALVHRRLNTFYRAG